MRPNSKYFTMIAGHRKIHGGFYFLRSSIRILSVIFQRSAVLAASVVITIALTSPTVALGQNVRRLDQGVNWTSRDWNTFYTTDQGSRIMPYSWMKALRQPNGGLFLRDSMKRYGFLPNAKSVSNPQALPVGFLVASHNSPTKNFSITCAACHTREITVNTTNFRIDGGPGFINAHAFLNDMILSVDHLLTNKRAFRNFQRAVKTPSAELRIELQRWYALNNLVMGQALPPQPWGIARLDALNLILNRSTGGDIGEPSANYLIPGNVAVADKPVRFPFLWNSDKQDLTQWAGTAVNGNKEYAMSRNVGEVCGVFGVMHPVGGRPPTDFLAENSVN
ncbi:MAG: di-heme-cytochrome C peroxidase, partial [Spartobacteria bacterium]